MFIRNSLRIVKILETSKKRGRDNICSIDNKVLILKAIILRVRAKYIFLRDVFKSLSNI